MLSSNQTRLLRESRFTLLAACVAIGFGLVVIGLLRLQVVQHDQYVELAKENRVRLEVLRAPRGAIYDRHGELLADSAPSFNVVFRPFPSESVASVRLTMSPRYIAHLSALAEMDSAEVRRRVALANQSGQTAMLRHNAPPPIVAGVEEWRSELPGLEVQIEPLRHYPNGTLASHLLGYAGEINDVEMDSLQQDGYRPGDLIGRTGVERRYEDILRGRDGAEFVVVNAMGKRVSSLNEGPPLPPVAGHSLTLTIDLKVQRALEEAMKGVERGGAVAIDPRDGGVLGMVSRPAYDPNEFSEGLTWARWRELSSGGANPLLDRALQGMYPPGSTFKIVTMLAALRYGAATPRTTFAPCTGRYFFGDRSFACWKPSGHGVLNLIEALQNSCDVYFYQLGPRVGLDHLMETARALGLGDRTSVDLPQERRGLIPDAAWYDRRWGAGHWRKGMMLNLAIGQGEILVTPLQLALMTAEVAVNGRALCPHVVEAIVNEPQFKVARPASSGITADAAVWDALHTGMERVIDTGTGSAAHIPGLRVAGKTGTAQNPHGKPHALFVCYAPVDNPQIAIAVVVENVGHGGTFAAPPAGAVLRKLFLPDSLQNAKSIPGVRETTEVRDAD
ncbi:MAG TPA: penicillin-binding protein 2 [Candidatus Saccharimonadaceae bacterium]|jgi:penicillin-binding protein 2|nr:penicillin-binding protein 2 [Candidatus Saccharimonadaceae bacterium]